ncbi:hypothetical protein D3C72_572180 [compost metagenome]|jgi:hypothetical protein
MLSKNDKRTIKMPILFFIATGVLMAIYWEDVVSNIAIIGSISTALAFMATAWAAFEARASAKAAMKAVSITADSLLETKKTSFKQWFELLLEQHELLYDEVRKELESDSSLKTKMDMNSVKHYYYTLTKKPALIKYVNNTTSILDYIDKEFYLNGNHINERKHYVEQLKNRIDSKVKLAIAVLGLNIDNNKTYNQSKLFSLLTKYDFFENELFFDKTSEYANGLENYITILFNKEYRTTIEHDLNQMIRNRRAGIINPTTGLNPNRYERLNFTVFWAYKNICGDIIREAFVNLPVVLRSSIEYYITNAPKEIERIKSDAAIFIGCSLKSTSSKPREVTIKNEKHLFRLVHLYLNNENKIDADNILISNQTSKAYLSQLMDKIEKYNLQISFLELSNEPKRSHTINDAIELAEKMIEDYKKTLDKFIVKGH